LAGELSRVFRLAGFIRYRPLLVIVPLGTRLKFRLELINRSPAHRPLLMAPSGERHGLIRK
jgi:hypothetical protein